MVSPDGKDFSTIVETGHARCAHCAYAANTASSDTQPLVLTLLGDLALTHSVQVWWTSNRTYFLQVGLHI